MYLDSEILVYTHVIGFILRRKPLYVAIAQRKEERQAQLQLLYAQRMAGLAGPSAVMPGGYSHLYYPAPGVVSQIPAPPGLMFQPPGIRPGWRANGIMNPSRPAVHQSPITLVSFIRFRFRCSICSKWVLY